ncbi:hypothetical protein THO17_13980 [Marinomonas sp. THO17]
MRLSLCLQLKKEIFARLADATDVELVTLINERGSKVSLRLFDLNVVFGCKNLAELVD